MKIKMVIILSVVFIAVSSFAQSTLITFDEFDASTGRVRIPNGYQGLNWANFFAFPGAPYTDPGYQAALVSGPNVAFNGGGAPADISSTSTFSLVSGYFTGVFNDGMSLEVQGYDGATLLYEQTYTISLNEPRDYIVFNFNGITDAHFISSGGTADPNNGGGFGFEFAVDNLTISTVPEPSCLALVGLGAISLVFYRRRK
jgi:hypothetical protein